MKLAIVLFFLLISRGHAFQERSSTNNNLSEARDLVDSLNEKGYSLWIRDPEKSIDYGIQAYKLANDANYRPGAAYAKRISGVGHWAVGEPRLALEDLYRSLDLYTQLGNNEGLANTQLNIGMVYADIDEDSTAMHFYQVAINEFSALELDGRIATTFTKIGSLHLKNRNYDDALFNFTNALKIHSKNNFDYGMAEAHNRLGSLYLEKKEPEKADYHLRQSLILSRKIDDKDGVISSMIQYGRLQNLLGEYENSNVHLKWGLKEASNQKLNNYRLAALKNLVDLKKNTNDPDSALFYYDWYVGLRDSVYSNIKSKQIAALEFQSDILKKQNELNYLTEKEENSRKLQWILLIGIGIIISLAFFLIKSLRQRNENQKRLLEQERIIAASELDSQKSKSQELELELEVKNKELTSYALNFVQKNEFLEAMNDKIQDLKPEASSSQRKKITEMERLLKLQQSKDKDWEDFRQHFEQVHSGFFTNLKSQYPGLSSNDLKVSALTRLNLSIKETSNILGISPESTKTARYRLRKKMNLDQETDLFDFLLKFDH